MEAAGTAICLVMKAVLLSGRWAGRSRRLGLEQAAKASSDGAEVQAENVMLRDTIEFLGERLACAERRLQAAHIRKPYSLAERLRILWCIVLRHPATADSEALWRGALHGLALAATHPRRDRTLWPQVPALNPPDV